VQIFCAIRAEKKEFLLAPLESLDAPEAVLAQSQHMSVMVFKHSRLCGISHRARREVEQFAALTLFPVYEVVVQTARPVSDAIAQRLGIAHASPQVLLVYREHVSFHASHDAITCQALLEAAQRV